MREIRLSPDGNTVAVRNDSEAGSWNAYFVGGVPGGGHWSEGVEVTPAWAPLVVDPDWTAPTA